MKLIYGVKDRPTLFQTIVFALQQLLAILAATIAVPMVVGHEMSTSAALFGAGAGTLVYLLFTKFKSPVFLGSSFAFIGSMTAAFAGGVSMALGYLGLLIGAVFAGLVYVVIAIAVKFAGVGWIDKLMPAVVIGPTVALIGLSLAGSAVSQAVSAATDASGNYVMDLHAGLCLICALVTLGVTIVCSVYGKKMLKMIPFICGILSGYLLATIFTLIGMGTNVEALQIIDFSIFKEMKWLPDFTFVTAFTGPFTRQRGARSAAISAPSPLPISPSHSSSLQNTLQTTRTSPPLSSMTFCATPASPARFSATASAPWWAPSSAAAPTRRTANPSAASRSRAIASVVTILTTAILAIVASFIAPFVTFLSSIPACVMGGVCIALYGFIAVSGLKMIQKVDLNENENLFVVSTILIAGVGGMALSFGQVTVTAIATALILGILVNVLVNIGKKKGENVQASEAPEASVSEETPETAETAAPAEAPEAPETKEED